LGGDLRQTRRTVAVAAGIGDMEAHLLLNHKLRGVSAGYITKGALHPHLVQAQERVSSQILRWVEPGASLVVRGHMQGARQSDGPIA